MPEKDGGPQLEKVKDSVTLPPQGKKRKAGP